MLLGVFAVTFLLIAYVFYQAYANRVILVKDQRLECIRNKLDRLDDADFQVAHAKYIRKVVLASSVKDDVKAAAREAISTFNRTSQSLVSRAKIDCVHSIPSARLLP
jgi:hypothetical protein